MRVAVVAEGTLHGDPSDGARRMQGLATALAARDHDVTVLCTQWWEGDHGAFEADRVAYRRVRRGADGPVRRFAFRLPARLRTVDPDVIHVLYGDPRVVHGARVASVLTRTPLVVEWYDHADVEGWVERAQALAARVPDRVITPSRMIQTGVRQLGRPHPGIDVLPTGIDLDRIRDLEPEPIADIVYARRLDATANLESLLLALAELRDLDWRVAVIGDGPAREEYEGQASDLRIADRVAFLGDLPLERRLRVLKGAAVYVHTAVRTPFAIELLRALACGCVGVVEYHVASSAHELVEHYDRGIRVTSEDELVNAIRRAADMDHETVAEAFEEYDEGRIVDRYLQCYREVADHRGLL